MKLPCLALALGVLLVTPASAAPISSICRRVSSSLSPAQLHALFNHRPVAIHFTPESEPTVVSTADDPEEPRPIPTKIMWNERPLTTFQLMALSRTPRLRIPIPSLTLHNPDAAAPTAAVAALQELGILPMLACQRELDHLGAWSPPHKALQLLVVGLVLGFVAMTAMIELAFKFLTKYVDRIHLLSVKRTDPPRTHRVSTSL
ncbi:MAG: hypothetical protein M1838_000555 [Thelocarpon superellum]|nr:MAG: hypothetical protein M1838_000555 [Thelocarpon superellum]